MDDFLPPDSVSLPSVADLYCQWRRYVWRMLQRLSIPARDVEDVVHDVFVVVHRKLHTFEQRAHIQAWIAGITYRVVWGYRRTKRNRCELLVDEMPEVVDLALTPEESTLYAQGGELVLQLLEHVRLERRIVLIMHDLDGIGVPEIVQALKLPRGTVRSRLDRARQEFMEAAHRMRVAEARTSAGNVCLAPLLADPGLLLAAERWIPDIPDDVGTRLWDRLRSTLENVSAAPPRFVDAQFLRAPLVRLFSSGQVATYVGGAFVLGAGVGALVYALLRPPPPILAPVPVAEPATTFAVHGSTPAPSPWPTSTGETSAPLSSASAGASVNAAPARALAAKARALPSTATADGDEVPTFAAERILLQQLRDAQKHGDETSARILLNQYKGQFTGGVLKDGRGLTEGHEKRAQ